MTNGGWTTNADRVRLGATNGNAVDLWLDDIGLDNAAMPLPTVPTGVRVLRYNYDGLQRLTGATDNGPSLCGFLRCSDGMVCPAVISAVNPVNPVILSKNGGLTGLQDLQD